MKSGIIHAFDAGLAVEFGVEEAIMIQHFSHWITKNKANERHFHDGRTWTYNSAKAFTEIFPYWSEDKSYRVTKSLVAKGILVTGNYSSQWSDRTIWYAFKDEAKWLGTPIPQICGMDSADLRNDKSQICGMSSRKSAECTGTVEYQLNTNSNPPLPPDGGKQKRGKRKEQVLSPEEQQERDQFIADFGAAYQEHFEQPYMGTQRDKAQTTELIRRAHARKLPVNGILVMVKLAWALKDDPNVFGGNKVKCSRLYNIPFLQANYDHIRGEVLTAERAKKNNGTNRHENNRRSNQQCVNGNTGTLNAGQNNGSAYAAKAREFLNRRVSNAGQL